MPELKPRKVPARPRAKDNLRQQPVCPLVVEEMAQLLRGAILVVVGIPDGDQGRVPGPLVRVEPRTRLGVIPGPVEFQNHLRVSDKICTVSHHEVSDPRARFLSGCLTDRRGAVRTPGYRILRRMAFESNSVTVALTVSRIGCSPRCR